MAVGSGDGPSVTATGTMPASEAGGRKRKSSESAAQLGGGDGNEVQSGGGGRRKPSDSGSDVSGEPIVKRKRGRPPSIRPPASVFANIPPPSNASASSAPNSTPSTPAASPKPSTNETGEPGRGRGRPRASSMKVKEIVHRELEGIYKKREPRSDAVLFPQLALYYFGKCYLSLRK